MCVVENGALNDDIVVPILVYEISLICYWSVGNIDAHYFISFQCTLQ